MLTENVHELDQHPRHIWQSPTLDTGLIALAEKDLAENRLTVIITDNRQQADHCVKFLKAICKAETCVHDLPSWETLAYDHFSPHRDIISQRLDCLAKLREQTAGFLICDLGTALTRLAPKESILAQSLHIKQNDTIDPSTLALKLSEAAYRRVNQVYEPGEFCQRGEIFDVYPTGEETPFRIQFFDDEVTAINVFDPETQRSERSVTQISTLAAEEYPLTVDGIQHFRQAWRKQFEGNPNACPMYQAISEARAHAGAEYYLPLFFEKLDTLFDYLPENALLVRLDHNNAATTQFWQQQTQRYEQYAHDQCRPICKPEQCFQTPEEWQHNQRQFTQICLVTENTHRLTQALPAYALPNLSPEKPKDSPLKKLAAWLPTIEDNERVLICVDTAGRQAVMQEQCAGQEWTLKVCHTWQEALTSTSQLNIGIFPFQTGCRLKPQQLTVIAESDLLGYQPIRQLKKTRKTAFETGELIYSLSELNIGDIIVHKQHGIGIYQGLETITTDTDSKEYCLIEYDEGDKIYSPISSLDQLSRYCSIHQEKPALSRLGTKQWKKDKAKAEKRAEDVAAELLKLYAEREAQPGHAFNIQPKTLQDFKNEFPFVETYDQTAAIEDILDDLATERCMDRLLCGDVGFGKTEVALQSAFVVMENHHQVVLLAPTTLLAQQHHKTCVDRFANWPFNIKLLTGSCPAKEEKQILAELKSGQCNIVVATHKILNPSITFKSLGLLIVDEEHRFGVKQKERIKALKTSIDILTMTATPIPRTLSLSLAKLRDLSIIATPPARRLSVKTFLKPFDMTLIKEALEREHNRGGQSYFLHNDIRTIPALIERLREACPEIKFDYAHGQMTEKQLEQVMFAFQQQRFHVLISTTIIESGIDIANANTIIVNKADRFGLAQLHQIRGRVGRSHHQAYAYMLIERHQKLTSDAKRRLEALMAHDSLGAGFKLATQDLEIRGAGDILGKSQSGQINNIGYGLYLEMLNHAIKSLNKTHEEHGPAQVLECEVDLGISALLPKSYISDVNTRLNLYSRLARCHDGESINQFHADLIDRFGTAPEECKHLIQAQQCRIFCGTISCKNIKFTKQAMIIEFHASPNVDNRKLLQILQEKPKTIQIVQQKKLRILRNKPMNLAADMNILKHTIEAIRTVE